jgi:transcriptional regulator with XRE-family HTH domain
MYSSPNESIQGINQTEIAKRLRVTPSMVSYYIKIWTDESHHPFPKPTVRIQQWIVRSDGVELWGKRFLNYDPMEIRVWSEGLDKASRRRRSEAQTASRAERKALRTWAESHQRPVGVPITAKDTVDPALEELTRRVAKLEETVIF